jgi:hypothetical protein
VPADGTGCGGLGEGQICNEKHHGDAKDSATLAKGQVIQLHDRASVSRVLSLCGNMLIFEIRRLTDASA